jgi:hypothetical protein
MQNDNINESTPNSESEGIEPLSSKQAVPSDNEIELGSGPDERRTVYESASIDLGPDDEPGEPAESGKVKEISERNRKNAQHSTGPKSEEGKRRSRMNAILHGLLIRAVPLTDFVVGGERRELQELFSTLHSQLRPEGRVEEIFVERLACIYFQLARLYRFQKGVAGSLAA